MRGALRLLARAAALVLLWWVLSEGDGGYAAYGALAVPLALGVSLWLARPGGAATGAAPLRAADVVGRLVGLVLLVGWYAAQVVLGGVDVARRLLRRSVDVAPVVVRTRSRLPAGPVRQLAVGMYGLLPGSLVADTDGDLVSLHSLDAELRPEAQWRALEERLAQAAGVALAASGSRGGS